MAFCKAAIRQGSGSGAAEEIENGHGLFRMPCLDQSLSGREQRGTQSRLARGVLRSAERAGECRGGGGRADTSQGRGGGAGGCGVRVGEELRQRRDGDRVPATAERADHADSQVAGQRVQRLEEGRGDVGALHLLQGEAGIVGPLLVAEIPGQRSHGVVTREIADLLEGIGPIGSGRFGRLDHLEQCGGVVGAHGSRAERANHEDRESDNQAHFCFPSES